MKALPLVLLCSLVSGGVAVGVNQWLPPASGGGDGAELSVKDDDETATRLERIEQQLEKLVAQPVEASAPQRHSVDASMIEDAVAAYFSKRGASPSEIQMMLAEKRGGSSSKGGAKRASPKDLWQMVQKDEVKVWDLAKQMKHLTDEEKAELVAMFGEQAKKNPYDADAQADYGHALIQKLMYAGILEQGMLGMKADKQFDKALAIDDKHWGARFSKAMSLSHWPDAMGKKPEAMKHFEILIGQQESQKPQPMFDQSYLVLGNLYSGQGKADKAKEVWQRGLQRFPNSAQLKGALGR